MRNQDPVQRSGNFIKGKLGENIVMRLLRDLGFEVFPNGYEVTQPAFITLMNKKRIGGEQIKKYRVRADFIVLKEADETQKGFCCEIEVKFRFGGNIEKRRLQEYDNDVRFIFVYPSLVNGW